MPDSVREIKSGPRTDWGPVLWFSRIYLPLALAAALIAIFWFNAPVEWVLAGLVLFSLLALISMTLTTRRQARQIAEKLETVSDVVWKMSAGQFDDRVPPGSREQIEELAATVDRAQFSLKTRVSDLESSRNQLRTVLNSMVEGVIAVDGEQRVLLVNEAACRLFPIQESSALGRPLWELVRSPQLQQWVTMALSEADAAGGEMELKSPQQRILSVRVTGLPDPSVAGTTVPGPTAAGAIVVASDMSQLRRLEQVRQEFVANASHELKTPLASIKACIETLLDGALEDVDMRVRFLQTVNEQTERLDRLVRDLLALTRIESQELRPALHPVAFADVIEICVNRHVQSAERKGMRLVTTAPPEPMAVLADEESLEQIFDNLIDNAVKYTNPGGTITVSWQAHNGRCRIEVEDTGIGIPQVHLQRIFERFYRVDRARSRELGGTGLGLAIVKHLVQILGGTISVTSRLGKGSIFTVELQRG